VQNTWRNAAARRNPVPATNGLPRGGFHRSLDCARRILSRVLTEKLHAEPATGN
jgi:hypothetical protein